MLQRKPRSAAYGYKAWQMVLTVIAMGLSMSVVLGTLPPLEEVEANRNLQRAEAYSLRQPTRPYANARRLGLKEEKPAIEVLPFNLQGEVPGPLLASILQQYMPESTADHADELRGTLPPGENPRMIVILPNEDHEVVF